MAHKPTSSARASTPRARGKSEEGKGARVSQTKEAPEPREGREPTAPRPKGGAGRALSGEAARELLVARAIAAEEGAWALHSDPLVDAQAARAVTSALQAHAAELARRGLSPALSDAALKLAAEIEDHLQGLGAATLAARGRSPEEAELLADAAQSATAVREAVRRVTRGPDGRAAAHAFGLGEPFNVRQPAHVLRALRRIVAAAKSHPATAEDIGLLADELQTLRDLEEELAAVPGADSGNTDSAAKLHRTHGALRAFFDLVAAKVTLGFAGDPAERARLLALIPRAIDRRQHGRGRAE
jgi:hypothetical protein